jgi:hypothetical protein
MSRCRCRRGSWSWGRPRFSAISSAVVQISEPIINSTPHNHFTTGPHRRVPPSANGCIINRACRCPTIHGRVIFSAGVQPESCSVIKAAPHYHFGARPDRSLISPDRRRVRRAGDGPSVSSGAISSAGVQKVAVVVDLVVVGIDLSAPDDHFIARPRRCMKQPGARRINNVGRSPTIRAGIVSSSSVKSGLRRGIRASPPDNHFRACPDSCVMRSWCGRVSGASGYPGIRSRIVFPTGIKDVCTTVIATPYNHFRATPNCCGKRSTRRSVYCACGYPAIRVGIIFPPAVHTTISIKSTPYDHHGACPHCRVIISGDRSCRRTRRHPTIGSGVVFAAAI